MTWFAFRGYGTIDVAGIQEKNLVVWGFHGYRTKALAEAHPNSVNFAQKAIVNASEADYQRAVASGEQPGGPQANLGRAITDPFGFAAGTAKSEFLHDLNLRQLLIQIAEVVLGIALIGVGVAKLTGTDNIIMKAATTAGKLAVL